jgi:DNA-binding transcriptional LysR family regulator
MDLDDIRLFVKVAELKSFVKAATELRIQTPLLSRRIARLEATLGVRLLQRTTRRVSLTEEGARFLSETVQGLDQLNSAVDSLNSLHGIAKGKVRVSSPIEIGQFLVEQAMGKFYPKYPDIQIEWDLLSAGKSLVENGIDLSIRIGHSHDQQSLIEKKIGIIELRVYRAPDFQLKLSKKPTIDELERLPWLVFTRGPLDSQRVKLQLRLNQEEIEIQPKNVRFRTNSLVSIRYAIIQGNGIGLLPPQIAGPEVAAGRLVPVAPNLIDGPSVDVYAAYPSREYLAPKVRVLIDWLSENFPKTK